jgi:hypothetical protein
MFFMAATLHAREGKTGGNCEGEKGGVLLDADAA